MGTFTDPVRFTQISVYTHKNCIAHAHVLKYTYKSVHEHNRHVQKTIHTYMKRDTHASFCYYKSPMKRDPTSHTSNNPDCIVFLPNRPFDECSHTWRQREDSDCGFRSLTELKHLLLKADQTLTVWMGRFLWAYPVRTLSTLTCNAVGQPGFRATTWSDRSRDDSDLTSQTLGWRKLSEGIKKYTTPSTQSHQLLCQSINHYFTTGTLRRVRFIFLIHNLTFLSK